MISKFLKQAADGTGNSRMNEPSGRGWHGGSGRQGEEGWMVGEGDGIAFRNASDFCPTKQSSAGDCIGPFLFQGANEF